MTTTTTIKFNSEAERKTFQQGLKIANAKIEAARKTNPTAEQISAHHIKLGNAIIAKRLESAKLTKTLESAGITTQDFKAIVKQATADTLKSFRKPSPTKPTSKAPTTAPSTARAKYHAGRTVKYLCSGGGLFGRTA